ncbi:hypothetical protein KFZ56_05500 [Virgibacillus sp. NKC19-3]|uniref:hypothetical protein n=1 Tax=Virgibacillus saliphilus TaxID=2831674 RepID=UPI001C9B0FB5|nr:hypothetical protein [Virgibacillus sp. NKC19-3]MBY7142541.1 hypothetical protein [Virgibacillus sp. NKC19-3]
MRKKVFSWKSYIFLISSIVVTLSMFLLDPISQVANKTVYDMVASFILVGLPVSLIMAVVAFSSKKERKLIPVIALLLTIFNVAVIGFFAWFGANFA